MEVGVRLEGGGIELATALGDGGAEFVERGEMPIDDRLIHQRPEMLGRLEFGGIGWQEDEANPIGDGQAFGSMPAGVVELHPVFPGHPFVGGKTGMMKSSMN